MRAYINLSQWLKDKVDEMFTQNKDTTAEEIVDRFTEKFEYVSHIGYMPAEEAEHAYDYYGDRVGFMMSNDGMTPEEYYVQHYMDEATAKSIVVFYKSYDGINRSLKDLAKYLYSNNVLNFSNVYGSYRLVQLSPRFLTGKRARDFLPVHKLYKPRYFQLCYGSATIRKCEGGVAATVIQPDSRKNEFICLDNHLVFSPNTVISL